MIFYIQYRLLDILDVRFCKGCSLWSTQKLKIKDQRICKRDRK